MDTPKPPHPYLSAMPKPLLKEGFSFYFWSDEGSELPQVHVS
jgi:hypothetical protein